jgi:hypothetical protein
MDSENRNLLVLWVFVVAVLLLSCVTIGAQDVRKNLFAAPVVVHKKQEFHPGKVPVVGASLTAQGCANADAIWRECWPSLNP